MMPIYHQLGLTQRPKVGISQCLTGAKVRYDGRDKLHPAYRVWLSELFELMPFCPEVAIGLPAPRPPIRLIQTAAEIRVIEPNSRTDFTQALRQSAQGLVSQQALAGFVLTTKSPSCGIGSTKLFNPSGELIGRSSGIFAATLQHLDQDLALIEDIQLDNREACLRFAQQAYRQQCRLEPNSKPEKLAQIDWAGLL